MEGCVIFAEKVRVNKSMFACSISVLNVKSRLSCPVNESGEVAMGLVKHSW